jgi:hypothetical protein
MNNLELLEFSKILNCFYLIEYEKLPYQINLIDELKSNENSHSRIFLKFISYKSENQYPFLQSFLTYLGNNFGEIKVIDPKFSAEKDRIDVLILDNRGKYAIIIENKINGAVDQDEQIERYVNKVKGKSYDIEQIYVLYLTEKGGSPSEKSKSLPQKLKKELNSRYLEINFKEHILNWLENYALPFCRVKDKLLISALEQYIDYLKGLFNNREIEKELNIEMKKIIEEKLELNVNNLKRIEKANKELKDINRLSNYLLEIKNESFIDLFKEWKNKLSQSKGEITTNISFGNTVNENAIPRFLVLGYKLIINGKECICGIGMDDLNSLPYFGLTCRSLGKELKEESITETIQKEFGELKSSPRWYYHETTSLNKIFTEFIDFYNKIEKLINKPTPRKN